MKTVSYEQVFDERLAQMSAKERAEHDAAYEAAGLALRMAELFYEARTAAGLTQTELARRMGTTQSTIAKIEGAGGNRRSTCSSGWLLRSANGSRCR